jgi:hypothetical protein
VIWLKFTPSVDRSTLKPVSLLELSAQFAVTDFLPAVAVRLLGAAGNPDDATVRLIVVVCVRPPEVPVTVTVKVPVAAVLLAVNVNVLVVVVLDGLNVAVTPLGNPEADKLTLPLKPFIGLTVIVLVPLEP